MSEIVQESIIDKIRNKIEQKNSNELIKNYGLNENYKKIDKSGIKIELYDHQKAIVYSMIELENTRIIDYNYGNDVNIIMKYRRLRNENGDLIIKNKFIYNYAILADPPGSGKTFEILSLIALNNSPKAIPEINLLDNSCLTRKQQCEGYIKIKYSNMIKSTLIFVASSVLNQWELNIKNYTNFTYFKVATINDLYTLNELIKSKMINKYDIILVRNHKSQSKFIFDEDIKINPINNNVIKYYYHIISNLSTSICWKRVIIDDFDTNKLPNCINPIHSLFTWYVSSTNKTNYSQKKKTLNCKFSNAEELILNHLYSTCEMLDVNMMKILNLHCQKYFLKNSMDIPKVNYNLCKIKNKNNKFISALSELKHNEIDQIIEMANSDLYENIAEMLDIKSNSIIDIFEKLLSDNYNKYRKALDILDFVELNKNNNERLPINQHPDYERFGSNIKYTKTMFLNFTTIDYEYNGIDDLINEIETEYKQIKLETGKMIERVKNNISNGICPVCNDDITQDTECVINKCCGVILCGICAFKIQGINRNNNPCFNCRSIISRENIIFIGKEIKLSNIINEEFENKNEIFKPKKHIISYFINNLINNNLVETKDLEIKKINIELKNILQSTCIMPKSEKKKIILFASFEYILNDIVDALTETNIKFWRLCGTHNNLSKIVEEFKNYNDNCILIINSIRYSSGLNLQFATDIILSHYIIDANIVTQMIGRAIRINRENELNVWFMLYENEISLMKKKYKFKIIN